MPVIDLAVTPARKLNAALHALSPNTNETDWEIRNPAGRHALAVGINAPITVRIAGHAGYYCGGMNALATILVDGNVGVGVGENMMSGEIRVAGDASQSAGATGHGGLLVVDGNASARCGIAMKGIDIIVKGSIGHMSAFMAQEGNLVVLGDAGEALGDSIYEARLFVRGTVRSLGADCIEKKLTSEDEAILSALLGRAGISDIAPRDFKLYGSARRLYHFHVDNVDAY
ncbi:MAG: protein glxC [Methylovirgula sp.]|jgi:methylamine---glutamate N-methyltransferase subunit B